MFWIFVIICILLGIAIAIGSRNKAAQVNERAAALHAKIVRTAPDDVLAKIDGAEFQFYFQKAVESTRRRGAIGCILPGVILFVLGPLGIMLESDALMLIVALGVLVSGVAALVMMGIFVRRIRNDDYILGEVRKKISH